MENRQCIQLWETLLLFIHNRLSSSNSCGMNSNNCKIVVHILSPFIGIWGKDCKDWDKSMLTRSTDFLKLTKWWDSWEFEQANQMEIYIIISLSLSLMFYIRHWKWVFSSWLPVFSQKFICLHYNNSKSLGNAGYAQQFSSNVKLGIIDAFIFVWSYCRTISE